MTQDEIKKLPTLLEVVEDIIGKEKQALQYHQRPNLIAIPYPSSISLPRKEYYNNYEKDKFIAVRLISRDPERPEKYALKPNLKDRMYLFRGQSGFYDPSVPTIFRKSHGRYVVENIYFEEFKLALLDHPLVQMLREGIRLGGHTYFFEVNIIGLAQHYGLKTCVMDLTSDIEVAKFFACTDYDVATNTYYPVIDEERYGVFYYWDNIRDDYAFQQTLQGNNLSNIGLQLFPRSGNQRGFLYSLFKGQNFHDSRYVRYRLFKHDATISKQIYRASRKGKLYFPEDELSSLAYRIRTAKTLSGEAFANNLKANPQDDKNENYAECKANNLDIDFRKPHISFNETEKAIYRKRIKDGFWTRFCSQIIFPNDREGRIMKELQDLPNNPKYNHYFFWK